MDKVTQQNAANAEESASASEELSGQAEAMNEIVDELTVLVAGSAMRNSSTTTSPKRHAKSLSQSDHVLHHIAEGEHKPLSLNHPKRAAHAAFEKAIPLDDDRNLDEFNG